MRALRLTTTLLGLAFGVTAPAAPEDTPRADDVIDEIQVTATRRPARASDVSAAVTLIPTDDVQAAKLATDALAGRPGVFLQQTTPGQGAAIVRGLKGSEVLHLVDGFRLNNAIFRNAPTQYLALISPATVDRMEVLRGSPASLYGSDAVGGVVQVLNRVPTFDDSGFQRRGEIGVGLDSAELERSLRASWEAGTDRIAGLLGVHYLETGDRRIGEGTRVRPSGYTSEAARAALSFTPDDRSAWRLDLQYGRQPETPRIDELVPGFGESEPASEEFFFAPNERLFVHLRHSRSDAWLSADWTIDLGWQRIVDDRRTRDFGSNVRRLESNASDLYGAIATANRDTPTGSWVAGAEVYFDRVSSRRIELDLDTGLRATVRSRFPDGSDVTRAALFANRSHDLTDRQTVTGGLRFSHVSVDLAASAFAPAATVDLEDFSADLGWSLQVTETVQLVANLGLGFRAPNVFDLGTLGERPGNRFNVPNPDLESEHITQFDVGLRYVSRRASAELVAWVLDYDDRITSVLTGQQTPEGRDIVQTQNRANARIWGLEGQARVALTDRVSGRLILNYTRGEQDDATGVTEPGDRIPPLNGRLSVDVDWLEDLRVEAYALFAAGQDRLSARDVRDPRIDPTGTAGWVIANIDAVWQPGEHWRLRLGASNLLDERYRVHGSGLDAPGRGVRLAANYTW